MVGNNKRNFIESPVIDAVQGLEEMLRLMVEMSVAIVRINNQLADAPNPDLHTNVTKIINPLMHVIFADSVLFNHVCDTLDKTEGIKKIVAPPPAEQELYNQELKKLIQNIYRINGKAADSD